MENKISPTVLEDIKSMNTPQLQELSQTLRDRIIEVVSKNGGHLASNLGVVEATVVLHKLFSSPTDKIIFDVGHQCYAHKILTGRNGEFDTLRQHGGISGFTNRAESEHDVLNQGHCGTSISAALGIAEANRLKGSDAYTVAVVGDGALTNGVIYEALNNCVAKKLNLIILINDNEMSISKNVGGLHKYLSKMRISKRYFSFKHRFEKFLSKIPLIGRGLASFFKWLKDLFKRWFVPDTLFEDIGLSYFGPVDGNDIDKLSAVLEEAKRRSAPCVVHMFTKKGKGYAFAEEHPEDYHGVAPFDIERGVEHSSSLNFSKSAGAELIKRAEEDEKICAITAAMAEGTGITEFAERFPDRFFDVGIAEEHAVTFAGGLASQGLKPIVFVYSTFAQRTFDQVFQDVSVQKLPLIMMLDRSGIVSGDGVTHQGIFDVSLFSTLPNVKIYSPESYQDISTSLGIALKDSAVSIIRYPRGKEDIAYESEWGFVASESGNFVYSQNVKNAEVVIVTYGRISRECALCAKQLEGKTSVGIIKLKRVYPLDMPELTPYIEGAKLVYIVEEGILSGGIAMHLSSKMAQLGMNKKVKIRAIENYVEHGSLEELLFDSGLTSTQLAKEIINEK